LKYVWLPFLRIVDCHARRTQIYIYWTCTPTNMRIQSWELLHIWQSCGVHPLTWYAVSKIPSTVKKSIKVNSIQRKSVIVRITKVILRPKLFVSLMTVITSFIVPSINPAKSTFSCQCGDHLNYNTKIQLSSKYTYLSIQI
jgi:hypothetical protein